MCCRAEQRTHYHWVKISALSARGEEFNPALDSKLLSMLIFLATMAEKKEQKKWPSFTMVEERMKQIYFHFYKETYKSSTIDRKTKELIAIAASLGFQCHGCLKGHLERASKYGATREEISEAICIAMGVAAASVVDQTDIVAEQSQIKHFE